MCGIAGFTGLGDRGLLARMNALQRHRGPDDAGEYWDAENRVGLAMQRLSIIDLAGGHQPMPNRDGTVWLVFNGEIFNAPTLRRELERRGWRFATDHSDTEVILHLYEAEGDACVNRLNGMFAFVIYDRSQRRLFGARDPFGIKPLYLHQHPGGLAWASELKCLRVLPTFSSELDPVAVEEYLGLQYVPQERSVFLAARRLRPGHTFTYTLDRRALELRRYYDLPFRGGETPASAPANLGEALRERFRAAVRRWSLADVPIACSLSGGLDSASVVAALAQDGQDVRTYTVGFRSPEDRALDETAEARRVAERYATAHHEIILDEDDLIADLPRMVWHLDEPYGGGLPSWYVFREIARDVKVAMTGTGGDELFSNYDKYRGLEERRHFALACRLQRQAPALSRAASFASGLRRRLRAPWLRDDPGRDLRQVHRREDGPLFWRYPFGLSFPTAHGRGFNERVAARPAEGLSAGRWVLERTFQAYAGACLRDRCVAVDFNNQLPDEFLHMTDRFAMAFSLEARTPFLDKEFAGFVLGLDARVRLTPDDPKSVFKRAVRPWLPEGHADRVKRGFVIPAARWLRGALRPQAEELFSESALRRDGLVRADFRTACYAPFLAGQTQLAETVWTVFMFRLWQEHVGRYGGSAEGRG